MKKTLLCVKKSRTDSYVGGVITIVNNYMDCAPVFARNGYNIDLFDYHMKKELANSKLNNVVYGLAQCYAILKQIKAEPCDVVHIHTSMEFLFLKDVFLAMQIKKKRGCKVMLTVHVGAADTVFNRIYPFQKMCLHIMNRYVDKMIFLAEGIRQELIQMGLDASRAEVLYNFHCLTPIQKEAVLPKTAALHLLFVGAIHRDKGIMEILTALEQLADLNLHLDLCGKLTDQSIRAAFEALVNKLSDRVTLHGYVSGGKKTALYERADALILPSYHEGFPLVVLEALAGGCAVISTKVGATPEILNEDNAIWVGVGNSEDVQKAIEKLYTNKQLLQNMQQKNWIKSKEFSIESHVVELCKIYDK